MSDDEQGDSVALRGLRRRTVSVVCHPDETGTTRLLPGSTQTNVATAWDVTMDAPDDSHTDERRVLVLSADNIRNQTPAGFGTEYLRAFGREAHIGTEEWPDLVGYWLEAQEIHSREVER